MPKKPRARPSPDILPDSLPPQRREEETPDVRREPPDTPDSLPPPDEDIPRVGADAAMDAMRRIEAAGR
jgi:hypothetical protein